MIQQQEHSMSLTHRFGKFAVIGIMALGLAGCASHYDRKSTNTITGAGLGAAAGAVVSQGDPWFTLGGAAAGGVLGNILTEDRGDRRSRGWDRGKGGKHYANGHRKSRHNKHHRRHR